MKRIAVCCLLAGIFTCFNSLQAQVCTPDPGCTAAQLICPPALSAGCEGDAYSQTITLSLGASIAGFPLTDITVNNLSGLPPGLAFDCTPTNCSFAANSSGCILVSGTPTTPGVYPIRANLLVNIGFVLPIDTAVGSITIEAKDCAGVCGGTASIDNCGICAGGTTGVLPDCDDADACTTDACDGSGGCLNSAIVCDDADGCTTDACDNGTCTFTPIPGCGTDPCDTLVCDDNNPCTADACTGGLCEYTSAAPVLAFDFQPTCNGDDAAITNNSTGVDTAGTYYLDQNSDGTIDMSLPVSAFPPGSTQFIPVSGDVILTFIVENTGGCTDTFDINIQAIICDDGDLCTVDSCSNATCSFPPVNCDDGDSCTTDLCDNGTCVNTAIPGCSGDPCAASLLELAFDFDDACLGDTVTITNLSSGVDSAGTFHIDENSDGTIDMTFPASMFPVGSTQLIPVPGNVRLTIIAENPDGCRDSFAINILAIICDDGDLCTTDACLNAACSSAPLVCDDSDSCTTDLCDNGVCIFTAIPGCGSGNPCATGGPLLAFDFQDACLGDTSFITNNSTGIDTAATYFIDQNSDGVIDISFPATAFPIGSSQDIPVPATVNLTLIVENPDGCRDTATVSILAIVCDDGDSCTTDLCDNGACTFIPSCCISNSDCEDNDACTTDSCSAGQCFNTPLNCDDSNDCTTDLCDNGQCVNTAIVCDDSSACTIDSCVAGGCVFAPLNCDDGDSCTTDLCDNGVCTHTNTCCASNADCDDNDGCTADSCANGACLNLPINCDDGYACTADLCNNGVCTHLAICCLIDTDCDDADACTADDCVNNICSRTPLDCDDNNPCTTDACLGGNCLNTALNCDDGDSCTADLCNNGLCTYTVLCCTVNADCGDNDACTVDSCNSGLCLNTALNCDDGDSCTTDLCNNGVCVNQGSCCNNNSDCYDGDICTTNECINGVCVNLPRCDDADACTDDHCSYYNQGHWNHGCHGGHYGNYYNGQGHSSGNHGIHGLVCYHTQIDCRDGDRCTIDECVNGQCINTPINCDDGDSCTTDICVLGVCKHTQTCCVANTDCNDFDPCTIDSCAGGVCINTPMNCDDNDVCTDDVCSRGWSYHHNHDDDDDNGWHNDDDDDDGWHDDDDDGNSYIGTCKHHPVDCRDGNICTVDFCDTLAGCVNDTIAGCCTSDADCDDSDACTADKCHRNSCSYSTVGGNVNIEALGDMCQDNGVVLRARAANGATYLWSTGETTQTIRGFADSTYSVTITNSNGCQDADTFTVRSAEGLLSSYVMIADHKIRLSRNTVFEGGAGARSNSGNIWLKNSTMVTAAGTFVRANGIHVSSGSVATTQIASPANIQLPPFENNPYPGGMDVNISSGTTATLNGSVYDDITIGSNSVITFSQTDLYFDNLYLKDNVTLKFAPCTKIHVRDKLRIGNNNTFNPDENQVVAYVEDYVEINSGSTVTADIYVRDGNIFIKASTAADPTLMKGLFIAESIEAKDNTHWFVNANCDASCTGTLQPLIVSQKTDAGSPAEAAITDQVNAINETSMKAYPNPFVDLLNIEFTLAQDSRVTLEIFSLSGQQIATVFEGFVSAGELRKVAFRPASGAQGMVIYRLQTEQGSHFGKAVIVR